MGSILSRVDSRQVAKDDKNSSARVQARSETQQIGTTVTSQISTREGVSEASSLSLSKKSAAEKVARRITDAIT